MLNLIYNGAPAELREESPGIGFSKIPLVGRFQVGLPETLAIDRFPSGGARKQLSTLELAQAKGYWRNSAVKRGMISRPIMALTLSTNCTICKYYLQIVHPAPT